jgi:hypothetical protein
MNEKKFGSIVLLCYVLKYRNYLFLQKCIFSFRIFSISRTEELPLPLNLPQILINFNDKI